MKYTSEDFKEDKDVINFDLDSYLLDNEPLEEETIDFINYKFDTFHMDEFSKKIHQRALSDYTLGNYEPMENKSETILIDTGWI